MFFGLSPLELVVLAGLALALFGPEKLPGAVRDAARIMRHIKSVGDGARAELLDQLGPELAELDPRRLHPQALLRETLGDVFDPLRDTRDDVRHEFREARDAARIDDHADRLAAVEAAPRAAWASASSTAPTGVADVFAMPQAACDAESDHLASGAAGRDPAGGAVSHARGAGARRIGDQSAATSPLESDSAVSSA